nr:LysM domain-containing protein [Ardenticatena sp.]
MRTHAQITPRGCLSVLALTLVVGLFCFVIGLVAQLGWRTLTAPKGQPELTVTPLGTADVESIATRTPTHTASPEPTATLQPTATPTPTSTPTPEPAFEVYVVQSGDTLAKIAQEFGVTVEAILEANPDIEDPSRIVVGQEIRIPRR